MGRLTFHQTPQDRKKALYDPDTGERWPDNEIWPVEYHEAMYHLLRIRQTDPQRESWATQCGQDDCDYPCTHDAIAKNILEQTWKHFLSWKEENAT